MMKAKARNVLLVNLMECYIQKANDGEYTMEDDFKPDLDGMFESKDFGIREVVLTSLIGKMIDEDFTADFTPASDFGSNLIK